MANEWRDVIKGLLRTNTPISVIRYMTGVNRSLIMRYAEELNLEDEKIRNKADFIKIWKEIVSGIRR